MARHLPGWKAILGADLRKRRSVFAVERRFWPHLRAHRGALAILVTLGITASVLECFSLGLFVPLLTSVAPGAAGGGKLERFADTLGSYLPSSGRSYAILLLIVVALLAKTASSYAATVFAAHVKAKIGHQLRSRIFHQLLSVSYTFLERSDWSRMLDVLASQTWRATQAVGYLISLLVNAGTVIVFGVLLASISVPILLITAVGLLIGFGAAQLLSRPVRALGEATVEENTKLGKWMLDGIAGMRIIHHFGLEPHVQQQFDESSVNVRRAFFKLEARSGLISPVLELFYGAMLVSMVFVAVQQQATLPGLLVAVLVLYRVQPQLKEIESARVNLIGLAGAVDSVAQVLESDDKPYLTSGSRKFDGLSGDVTFENVSFSYAPELGPALRQIELRIPKGKTTAIVGPSGAGKSTLIQLLCRLYDPTEGEIRVGGTPLREYELRQWRDRVAVAGQDAHLFNTTVRENIGYGRLGATDEEIVAAAEQAHADHFIRELPDGYDTAVGDTGARLSGGQRQRIALARAFLRKPEILILDEATNALDGLSEQVIQDAVESFGEDGTVVIVAHRYSTIRSADQVIVIEGGRVVEQGPLRTLLDRGGLFSKLYQLQALSTSVDT